jgi:predicted amidohydrolase
MSLLLARQGADILTFPSAFTVVTGIAHWEVLLRARAIETQCYVIASAQTGKHNDVRQTFGHAMVVDPWGAVVAQCHEGTDLCLAQIDHDYISEVRQQIPVYRSRRHDLYSEIKASCIS